MVLYFDSVDSLSSIYRYNARQHEAVVVILYVQKEEGDRSLLN
jgi:hypothetical protein